MQAVEKLVDSIEGGLESLTIGPNPEDTRADR